MLDFHEKRRMKRYLYSKPAIAFLALVIIFLMVQVWGVAMKDQSARARSADAERELRELEERETELTDEIKRLSTEHGVEEELRRKYDIVKEGERVIVLVQPEDSEEETDSGSSGIFGFFKGLFD